MSDKSRTFKDSEAKREQVPLLLGLAGPSGGGKTYSALRLATGMQRVTGGEIFYIDTEAKRALHYAQEFSFRHVPFDPPFSPLDYLAAIEHCQKRGAKIVVVDSMSHEHEGPGGVLEWHDAEAERLADLWRTNIAKTQIPAWGKPKAARRRLINCVLQLGINAIFCFRAKEKIKIVTGKDPIDLGWQPIAGEEFIYEMMASFLLPPSAGGVPEWEPERPGEKQMIKLPGRFAELFRERAPLSEDHGEGMAKWAAGEGSATVQGESRATPVPASGETTSPAAPAPPTDADMDDVIGDLLAAPDTTAVEMIASEQRERGWSREQGAQIGKAKTKRLAELRDRSGSVSGEGR